MNLSESMNPIINQGSLNLNPNLNYILQLMSASQNSNVHTHNQQIDPSFLLKSPGLNFSMQTQDYIQKKVKTNSEPDNSVQNKPSLPQILPLNIQQALLQNEKVQASQSPLMMQARSLLLPKLLLSNLNRLQDPRVLSSLAGFGYPLNHVVSQHQKVSPAQEEARILVNNFLKNNHVLQPIQIVNKPESTENLSSNNLNLRIPAPKELGPSEEQGSNEPKQTNLKMSKLKEKTKKAQLKALQNATGIEEQEDEEEKSSSMITEEDPKRSTKKLSKQKYLDVPLRKLPQRKKKEPEQKLDEANELQLVLSLTPDISPLLGYSDIDQEKLYALWQRSDRDRHKFFIKLKRNLSYYKKTLRIGSE